MAWVLALVLSGVLLVDFVSFFDGMGATGVAFLVDCAGVGRDDLELAADLASGLLLFVDGFFAAGFAACFFATCFVGFFAAGFLAGDFFAADFAVVDADFFAGFFVAMIRAPRSRLPSEGDFCHSFQGNSSAYAFAPSRPFLPRVAGQCSMDSIHQ